MLSLFLLWPTGSSLGLVLAVLGIGIWVGVQHLGYLEFGELARVAHRTLDQPQIFVNNLAIRRATEELKVARDYEQVRRILLAAFGSNDFDSFELKLDVLPGEFVPFGAQDSAAPARRNGSSFCWNKPGTPKNLDNSAVWTIALDLLSSGESPLRHPDGVSHLLPPESATRRQSPDLGISHRACRRSRSHSRAFGRSDRAARAGQAAHHRASRLTARLLLTNHIHFLGFRA